MLNPFILIQIIIYNYQPVRVFKAIALIIHYKKIIIYYINNDWDALSAQFSAKMP